MYKVIIKWETGEESSFDFSTMKDANDFAADQRELFPGLMVLVEIANG